MYQQTYYGLPRQAEGSPDAAEAYIPAKDRLLDFFRSELILSDAPQAEPAEQGGGYDAALVDISLPYLCQLAEVGDFEGALDVRSCLNLPDTLFNDEEVRRSALRGLIALHKQGKKSEMELMKTAFRLTEAGRAL